MASSSRWKKPKVLSSYLRSKQKRPASSGRGQKRRAVLSFPLSSSQSGIGSDFQQTEQENGADFDDLDGSDDTLTHGRRRTHEVMHKRQVEAWERVRPRLLDCFTASLAMPPGQLCMSCPNHADFRCRECSSLAYYCRECCQAQHRYSNFLHTPERWVNDHYVYSPLENVVIPLTHDCASMYSEKVTVVSSKGQHHSVYITCCGCKSIAERLLEVHLWPATPVKPKLAFTLDLMDIIHYLVLECKASLHDISNYLKAVGTPQPMDKAFYKQLTASYPQYRAFKRELELQVFHQTYDCPSCPKLLCSMRGTPERRMLTLYCLWHLQKHTLDPIFVSMDANFRLCRRSKAARISRDDAPLLKSSFFCSQDKVDSYVQSFETSTSVTLQSQCNDFKAGDVLRSRTRYHALDETAVFGAICRHDFPLRLLSLKHGERLAYADYLLSAMVTQGVLPPAVNLLYDIGCKLQAHWKANVNHFQPLLDRCQVAIPIFHSYAHNALCQHRFSPRNAEGFGLTDGENVERLWSFLGRFAKMSKEMSPSNRIDLLGDALMHYCSLKAYTMGKCFVERYVRANKQLQSCEKETADILCSAGLSSDQLPSLVQKIEKEERTRLTQCQEPIAPSSWRVQYVTLLSGLETIKESWTRMLRTGQVSVQGTTAVIQELTKHETMVRRFELQHGVAVRWDKEMEEYQEAVKIASMSKKQKLKEEMLNVAKERLFYMNTLTYHAGGQKQAQRVSKLIQSCTHRIKKLHSQYQELQKDSGDVSQVTVKQVCDLQSSFWAVGDHTYPSAEAHTAIPPSLQRRLLEVVHLKNRCAEERQLIVAECIRTVEFYRHGLLSCNLFLREILQCNLDEEDLRSTSLNVGQLDMYSTISSLTRFLPLKSAGSLAAVILQCKRLRLRLERAEAVASYIVKAYWSRDGQPYLKCARKLCTQNLAIPVLPIELGPAVSYDQVFSSSGSDTTSEEDFDSSESDFSMDSDSGP